MHKYNLSYKSFGEKAILIEWPSKINETILHDILAFKKKIEQEVNLEDIIVGYNSLVLVSNFRIEKIEEKIGFLKKWYKLPLEIGIQKANHWEIPVCYDQHFSIDIEEVSQKNMITNNEVIKLHTSSVYTVYFVGFLPGFLYLGGLNSKLNTPRKDTPRLRIPKGAVAIGGSQTGVYPTESSGGWNIIGNSPISFFNVENTLPCFAKTGDKVSFKSISLDDYKKIKQKVEKKGTK